MAHYLPLPRTGGAGTTATQPQTPVGATQIGESSGRARLGRIARHSSRTPNARHPELFGPRIVESQRARSMRMPRECAGFAHGRRNHARNGVEVTDGDAKETPRVTKAAEANDIAHTTEPQTTPTLFELLQRVEEEYREMPGLSLTVSQAERLWGLDRTTCAFVLTTLIERRVLTASNEWHVPSRVVRLMRELATSHSACLGEQ